MQEATPSLHKVQDHRVRSHLIHLSPLVQPHGKFARIGIRAKLAGFHAKGKLILRADLLRQLL
jgi:hypothetical protein